MANLYKAGSTYIQGSAGRGAASPDEDEYQATVSAPVNNTPVQRWSDNKLYNIYPDGTRELLSDVSTEYDTGDEQTGTTTGQTGTGFSTDATPRENIYNMTAPTANMPNAPDIQSLLNMNYTVGNPYTRGLLERGLQQGQVPWMLTPEGQQAEEARRIATLEQAVVPQAQAAMGTALTDVQRQMQKAGKLSSSATTLGMMRTSEQFAADIAGTMASGTLNIYNQISQAYSDEANRQLQGGLAVFEAETGLRATALNAEMSKYATEVGASIASMQAQNDWQISQIQADINLSAQEKDIRIAELNAQTARDVAQLEGQIQQQVANIYTASSERIATANSDAAMSRLQMELSQADKELAQRSYQFSVTDLAQDGTPRWLSELQSMEATQADQLRLAYDRLEQESNQFNIATEEGRDQFMANLRWARESLGMTQAQERELFMSQMAEGARQFDVTTAEGRAQFAENIGLAERELDLREQDQTALLNLYRDQLSEQTRQFDMSLESDREKYFSSLAWEREQFNTNLDAQISMWTQDFTENQRQFDITNQQQISMWSQAFIEDIRQFNLSNEQNISMWSQTFVEDMRRWSVGNEQQVSMWAQEFNEAANQFDVTQQQRATEFTASLELMRDQYQGDQISTYLDAALTILKDPAVQKSMSEAKPEALASLIASVMQAAITGGEAAGLDLESFREVLESPSTARPSTLSLSDYTKLSGDEQKLYEFVKDPRGTSFSSYRLLAGVS